MKKLTLSVLCLFSLAMFTLASRSVVAADVRVADQIEQQAKQSEADDKKLEKADSESSEKTATAKDEAGFKPMFNGKDLSGWVLTNTPERTWSFEDGVLVCSGKPIGEVRTEKMYQNFIIEVEWRHMKPRGNAGIFIWADDITARGQPFHRGIEVQVLENAYGNTRGYSTHGDIFPIHGAKMTPVNGRGGSRAFPIENRSKPSPEWNHYRIECNDGKISLAVNGKKVTEGTECWPKKGYICIESEGGVVHYRNMKIKELPPTPIAKSDMAIANRGFNSHYSGIDLKGWKVDEDATEHWKPRDWVLTHSGTKKSSVATEKSFGNIGFIVDVRLKNDNSTATILLRDSTAARIELHDTHIKAQLEKTSRWNRIEGELQGDRLSVTVNGHVVFEGKHVEGVSDNGPIRLVAEGDADFANIYTRKLTVEK